ncbi:MAG: DUF927 domain-containing protein [Selenomonadaceae bacterium]|nr:DUF927 domain-containing protein [Selenomonadaceae bacterium]
MTETKIATAKFKQNLANLPKELLTQPRFFPVKGKVPLIEGWNNPENQKLYNNINGNAGFDTNGHGKAIDYCFLDFDHVLNKDGSFVNDKIADFVNHFQLVFPEAYIEFSKSFTGLHAFLKPTAETFEPMKPKILHFDKEAKLEIFYRTQGRYCVVTGNKYDNGGEIPQGSTVDDYLNHILAEIQKQEALTPKNTTKKNKSVYNGKKFDLPLEYNRDLAIALLDVIPAEGWSDSDWLSIISSCKNVGVPENITDLWCAKDPEKYNQLENKRRYDSLNDPSFDIQNLIGKAPYFDYQSFYARWIKMHSQFDSNKDIDSLAIELNEVNKKIAEFEKEKIVAIEKLKAPVLDFSKDVVLSDEMLTAAAFASLYDVNTFTNFKFGIQKQNKEGTIIREWQRAVRNVCSDIKKRQSDLMLQQQSISAQIVSFDFLTAHPELKGFIFPEGYVVSDSGIKKIGDKIGDKPLTVSRVPAVIKGKSKNVEDKTFKLILAYLADNGKWQSVPATGEEIIFDTRKLIGLRAYGFPVTSTNAHLFVEFLDEFKSVNKNNLPSFLTVSRCGWFRFDDNDKDYFIDPRRKNFISTDEKDIEITVDESNFTKSLKSVGSLDEWRKAYDIAKKSPIARLIVAASIAPALLKILGERNFVLYFYGPTRGGKSTGLFLGASAVGNTDMVISFDGTNNGLLAMAAETNDYPFFIDEKQSADKKLKEQFQRFIYSVANGKERTRANKEGFIKHMREWLNITLCNGESILIGDNATGGAFTRLLQIRTPKTILPDDDCKIIRDIIKKHYGLALPLVIDEIFKYGFDELNKMYKNTAEMFARDYPEVLKEYCRYMTVITLADMLLNLALGADNKTAYDDAVKNAENIFPLIPTLDDISDAEREIDFVKGFIAEKSTHFEHFSPMVTCISDYYGKFEKDFVYITVRALQKACEEGNFDKQKVVADLIDAKFFIANDTPRKDSKSKDSSVSRTIGGVKCRCYRVPISFIKDNETDYEEL